MTLELDFGGFAQTGNERNGEGSRTQTPLLPSTEKEWCDRRATKVSLTRNQGPHSFGSIKFMPAYAEQVDPRVFEIVE